MTPRRERGAAAVELAIVLPLLLLLVGGIIDFGRLMFAEVMVTNAAREGARSLVVGLTPAQATTSARLSMPNFAGVVNGGTPATVNPGAACSAGANATVTVSADNFDWLLLDALAPIASPDPSSTAVMRCGG